MAQVRQSKRPIGKHTDIYQLWFMLFKKEPEEYPFYLAPLAKGKAVNMAIMLNRVNAQEAYEAGKVLNLEASDLLMYSAKAKDLAAQFGGHVEAVLKAGGKMDGDETWYLEISKNIRHSGETRSTTTKFFLDQLKGQQAMDSVRPQVQAEGPRILTPEEDKAELEAFLRTGKEGN